jgi:23S rRNA (pseudouridine1915-N3)-methyltransferase
MRVTIVAIGRERSVVVRALFDDYARRCPWPIRVVEVALRRALPLERRLADEASRLLSGVPDGAVVVALDERGRLLGSRAFAQRIAAWQQDGRDLAFLVGGPDGLGPEVIARADLVLALGPMTWPHLLVRVLLAEQLYRASTILAGHPYHRE